MALLRSLPVLALLILGAWTLPAQPPRPTPPDDDEPLLFGNQPVNIQMTGLRGWACAVSGDGKRLVTCAGTGEQPGEITVWDLAAGTVRRTIKHTSGVRNVAFLPDNRTVAAACYGGELRLYDVESGELKALGKEHAQGISAVAVSHGGQRLVTSGLDKVIRVWQLPALPPAGAKPAELKSYARLEEHTDRIFCVAVSKDGKSIASGGVDNTARVWDMPEPAADGKPVVVKKARTGLSTGSPIESLAFSPDGRTLAVSRQDGFVRIWDHETGDVRRDIFFNNNTGLILPILSVAFSPDGENLAIGVGTSGQPNPGEVRIVSVEGADSTYTLIQSPSSPVRCVAFLPDGNVVCVSEDRVVRAKALGDYGAARELKSPADAALAPQIVLAVAWSRDGQKLAVAGENRGITLYDVATKQSRAWPAHDDVISALAFGPDGKLASAAHDGTIKVWDISSNGAGGVSPPSDPPPARVLTGHANWVFAVAFSFDGKKLVSGGYDKTVRVWDVSALGGLTPPAPVVIKGHSAGVRAVAFLPGDREVVSAGADRLIRFWDAQTGQDRGILRGHKAMVRALAVAADGRTLASGSEDRTVKLWSLTRKADGRYEAVERAELTGHQDMVGSLAFSPKGRTLAVGTWVGSIHLWDPSTGRQRTVMRPSGQPISTIAFSPDGQKLAAGGYDRSARFWTAPAPPPSQAIASYTGHGQAVNAVALSPDGRWAATGDEAGVVRLFERGGPQRHFTPPAHAGGVTAVAFAPDSGTLATAGRDKVVRLWQVDGLKPGGELKGHGGAILAAAYSPGGEFLATAGEDRLVIVWDAKTNKEVKKLTGHAGAVRALAFAPNGTLLASAGADRAYRLWDTRTWAVKHQSPAANNNGEIYAIAFSPDGASLALAHNQEQVITPDGMLEQQQFRNVMFVDVATGKPRPAAQNAYFHNDYVTALAYSPDGTTLITACRDMNVRYWSLSSNQVVRTIAAHRAGINAVALDAAGGVIATAGDDRVAALWPARFRQDAPRATLAAQTGQVWFAEFSHDGTMLVTGGDDKIVRVRKGLPGTRPFNFEQPLGACFSLATTPDGKVIASGHGDGTILFWDAATGKRLKELKGHADTVWSLAFVDGGKRLVSGAGSWNQRAQKPGEAKLWDVEKGTVIRDYAGQSGAIYVAMPSPDGKTLATGSHDGTLRLWELETGKLKHTLTAGTPVRTVAFLPDGATVISAGHEDPNFTFWDVATGKPKAKHTLPNAEAHVNRLRVSPDGKTLALVTNAQANAGQAQVFATPVDADVVAPPVMRRPAPEQTGTLLLWDLATNKVRAQSASGNRMLDGEFTPDGTTFVTVGGIYAQVGEIKLWRTGDAKPLGELHGHPRWLEAVAFTKDGRLISGGGLNQPIQRGGGTREVPLNAPPPSRQLEPGELRIWDLAGFKPELELKGHSGHVGSAAFHPNGTMLATGGGDKTVVVWDLAPTRKGLLPDKRTLDCENQVRAVRFSPDGSLLAVSDEGGRVTLWNPHTGVKVKPLGGHAHPCYNLAFSKDGKTLASCAGNWRTRTDGEVKLWDVATGRLKARLAHERPVWGVAFSPDDRLLATGGGEGVVRVFDAATHKPVRELRAGPPLRHIAFSPDGSLLAAAPNNDQDAAIRLWDTTTWQERATLRGHFAMVFTARFSPDGKTLASASKDATVKVWDVPPSAAAASAKK